MAYQTRSQAISSEGELKGEVFPKVFHGAAIENIHLIDSAQ
jgi:hypothetical protein